MKTYSAREGDIVRKWYIVDGSGKVLGRLATEVAKILRGKHKPTWTPHMDTGDNVIVLNAEKVVLKGAKLEKKVHRHYTGFPGGLVEIPYDVYMKKHPERAVADAIRGMLPHNCLGRKQMKKLKVYRGGEHPHGAQKPTALSI